MTKSKKEISTNEAWSKLIEEYHILDEIEEKGSFCIEAKQINEVKQARLMAKWDSSESLPVILRKHKINILPTSRGSYVLGKFKLYEEIPTLSEHVTHMQKVEIPQLESIDIDNIGSEANAINVLLLSNVLDDFLCEDNNVATFAGRMGTGAFDFLVDRYNDKSFKVNVRNAQCEIDAGIENNNSVVIIEAKNIVHPDFHIRQLYYPYRLWTNKVKKPIRLVFSIYTNQIFRLLEYKFLDVCNYSSIQLVKEKNYSLQDTEINNHDLEMVLQKTEILYDDFEKNSTVPFIQANSFERIISLIEILGESPRTKKEIAGLMLFDERQSDYYFNAGKYLGIFEKKDLYDEFAGKEINKIVLTKTGKSILNFKYKDRQLKLVGLILQHRIFNDLFKETFEKGLLPDKEYIQIKMKQYGVCSDSLIERRASSVLGWLQWIFNLTKI